jgi:lysophospholipase L1-like esterase
VGDVLLYAVAVLLPPLFATTLYLLIRLGPRQSLAARRFRLFAGNVLIFLLLSSALFVVFESYYRFWSDTTDSFSQTKTSARWFERHYQRNNAGFRDNVDYRFARKPNTRRLSFIGDSFTAGQGVARVEDRFANRIRSLLAGDREVHVLAELGRDTGAEIKLVRDLIRTGYEFDTIVLVYCLNDINDLVAETGSSSDPRPEAKPGFLVRHSYLINTYYFRFRIRWDPSLSGYYDSLRSAYDGALWEEHARRLRSLTELCRAAPGGFLVVTFPFLHSLGPEYAYRPVHEKLARFWQDLDVAYLDLLSAFDERRGETLTVNRYDAHPNARAHAVAAEAIAEFLRDHL